MIAHTAAFRPVGSTMVAVRRALGVLALAGMTLGGTLEAQRVVVAPTSGLVNSGGTYTGTFLYDTYNQSGLSAGYTAGVTDFDYFLSLSPTHNYVFSGHEWFSDIPVSAATITYDFGSLMTLSALALWNEDASGIGLFNLYYSLDGTNFFTLLSGAAPVNNAYAVNYPAEVFSWTAQSMRYVRFEMSGCPQIGTNSISACAIGEVAFARELTEISPVPEPATMGLLATGLLGLAGVNLVRRRKQVA